MKATKNFRRLASLKFGTVILFISISIIAFYSCGNNRDSEVEILSVPLPPSTPSSPLATDTPESDSVYTVVDELPSFAGGNNGLMKYIIDKTVYPAEAKKMNIVGKVIVKFVVGKDCSVSQVELVNGINPLLDAEALRVVSSLPKFEKPGIKSGKAVPTQFLLPITFSLE